MSVGGKGRGGGFPGSETQRFYSTLTSSLTDPAFLGIQPSAFRTQPGPGTKDGGAQYTLACGWNQSSLNHMPQETGKKAKHILG